MVTRVWDAFLEWGPWTLLVVPTFFLVVAGVGALALHVLPAVVRVAMAGLAAVALTLALVMTMRPADELGTRPRPRLNPLPLLELVLVGGPGAAEARLQALGNFLLLLPLGTALGFLMRPSVAALLLLSVALSLEATQWLLATGRVAETADVMLNLAGGLLGLGLSMLAIGVLGPRERPPPIS